MMPDQNTVEYNIILQAAKAATDLQKLTNQASSFGEKVQLVTAKLREFSAQSGLSMKSVISMFKDADKAFAEVNDKSAFFGNLQKQGWQEVEKGAGKAVRGIDAVRIALGVLVSMLIFQVIQAVQQAFGQMINNLREAELAVYNLINAERRLSEQGIEVTPKGLQETIDGIQKLVPILSKIQAEELVSRIATNVAPALHLTNEQIKQLSESIALLYIRNKALGKSFDEVESQVTNAFLTGKVSQGINQLGVKISDQIVKDEALRLGLVKTAKEFDNLSGDVEAHVKSVAMLSVVYQNARQDMGSVDEYLKTSDAAIEETKTAWSNLLTFLGQIFGPGWTLFLQTLAKALNLARRVITADIAAMLAAYVALTYKVQHPFASIGDVAAEWQKAFDIIKKNIKDVQDVVGSQPDTPTSIIPPPDESTLADWSDLEHKIEAIIEDTNNAIEDLQKNLDRKRADLDLEYQRKAADANRDYLRKIADINGDYERKIADIKHKQREQDKQDEAKYQLQLWELRQKYLMDLEDALHARDARQVLRLQRQYEFDKEDAARKHALDTKTREESQRAELKSAKQDRDQRLADAKREYEQKLADQRVAKQRELDDLNTWYAREQADIQTAQQRKLETLLKGWVDEQKITADNAAQVYGILAKYFGPGGMTDALYKYMMSSLIASTQGAIAAAMTMGTIGGQAGTPHTVKPPSTSQQPFSYHPGGYAEGGTLLATRPTTAVFGEGGPELVNFTPLNRIGKNIGKIFGDTSGGGGVNGTIRVTVDLSPDLQGRIVEQSMDGVAEILSQVNRSRV